MVLVVLSDPQTISRVAHKTGVQLDTKKSIEAGQHSTVNIQQSAFSSWLC